MRRVCLPTSAAKSAGLQRPRRRRDGLGLSGAVSLDGHGEQEHGARGAGALRRSERHAQRPSPTADELTKAKEAILNSFVFKVDSKTRVLRTRMGFDFYGYPPDYYDKYQAEIGKITLDDVKRVAAKYLNPGGFAVLVVGKVADFDAPLSTLGLGPVNALDITIPPPPAPPVPAQAPGPGQTARPAGQ